MKEPKARPGMEVRCIFSGEGEDIRQIILRSFALFVRRELEKEGMPSSAPRPAARP